MINRDDAKRILEWDNRGGLDWFVDDIYNSIGSCAECKKQADQTCVVFDVGYSSDDEFFCKDFERKET